MPYLGRCFIRFREYAKEEEVLDDIGLEGRFRQSTLRKGQDKGMVERCRDEREILGP